MKDSFDYNDRCQGTKHGIYSCYGGNYNEILEKRKKSLGGSKEKRPINLINVLDQFGKDYDAMIKKLEEMCKCCKEKPKLYIFSADLNATPEGENE